MLKEFTTENGMRIWHTSTDSDIRLPTVLLLHERYGPVEHSFNVLERFAQYGFVAAMPDFFHRYQGDRNPVERAEARVDIVDTETVTDIDATLAYLRSLPYVDGNRVGVAGFCLSGRAPIVYAAARPNEVSAIAITHGGIYPRDYHADTTGQAPVGELIPQVDCPVLGMFGENDRLVPLENISRFRREMERKRKNYWIRVFADTPHGWMNTTTSNSYRQAPSEGAWKVLGEFFSGVFAGEWNTESCTWCFEPDAAISYDFSV